MIFKEEPLDFNKEIDVVGCYLQHNGCFVLLHRHLHKTEGDKLGLPAGKIDSGESMHQAMQREIQEETGLTINNEDLEYFESVFVRNEGHDLIFHMFSMTLPEKPMIKVSANEHQGYCWTSPQEALNMNLIHDLDECIRLFYKVD